MNIKRRHIAMARAAYRAGFRAHSACAFEAAYSVLRWHRAANHKGKHQ